MTETPAAHAGQAPPSADERPAPPIGRADLLSMAGGLRRAGILRAALELGLFDALADGPRAAGEIASKLGVSERGCRILLRALAALGLVQVEDGTRFHCRREVADALAVNEPGGFGDTLGLAVSRHEWDGLNHLAAAVRRGGTVLDVNAETPDYSYWSELARTPTPHTPAVAELLADAVAAHVPGDAPFSIVDVACGHGIYGYAVASRIPHATVRSIDWPTVLDLAEGHARRLAVHERVTFAPGDMFTADLAGPHELALATNVLHHFSPERVGVMLRRIADSLRPGGKVGIVAITADEGDPRADPAPHLFAALMLAWTGDGEPHSLETYGRILAESGFGAPEVHCIEGVPLRLVLAERL